MARVPYRDLTGLAPQHQKTLLARNAAGSQGRSA